MNFIKKQISIFLSLLMLTLSPFCYGTNNNTQAGQKSDNTTVKFVPDKDIIIDSSRISESLSDYEKKQLTFTPPDKNSTNLLSKELFPNDSPKPDDIQQGKLGVCYFFAALSTFAEQHPDLIKKNLVEDDKENVTVKFFNPHDGTPLYIKVQKTVPNLLDKFKFTRNDCLWVHMYLKAFVASGFVGIFGHITGNGKKSYKSAEGGVSNLVMRMLTGQDTEIKNAPSLCIMNNEKLYNKIEETLSGGCIITCNFTSQLNLVKICMTYLTKLLKKKPNTALFGLHAYSIKEVRTDENGQKWITIRNPWGHRESLYDANIDRRLRINNGYFTLKFEDFASNCCQINFGKKEEISKRSVISRSLDLVDPVQIFILCVQDSLIVCGAAAAPILLKDAPKLLNKLRNQIHTSQKNLSPKNCPAEQLSKQAERPAWLSHIDYKTHPCREKFAEEKKASD